MAIKTRFNENAVFDTTHDDHRPLLRQGGSFKANMNFWQAGKKLFSKIKVKSILSNLAKYN
jgi:hypothetical protein